MEEASETEKAWAAGFFDGEGSTCLMGRGVCMTIQQNDRTALLRFDDAVGNVGRFYGPYEYQDGRTPRYEWRVYKLGDLRRALAAIWPYIGEIKRQQALKALETFESRARTRPMKAR